MVTQHPRSKFQTPGNKEDRHGAALLRSRVVLQVRVVADLPLPHSNQESRLSRSGKNQTQCWLKGPTGHSALEAARWPK